MKMYIYAAISAALVLVFGVSNWQSYEHGVKFQKGADAQEANTQYEIYENALQTQKLEAQKLTAELQATAAANASELADYKSQSHETTNTVIKYVDKIAPNPSCDIPDELFNAINEAAAGAQQPSVRSAESGRK